jgi:hypothetical protein
VILRTDASCDLQVPDIASPSPWPACNSVPSTVIFYLWSFDF